MIIFCLAALGTAFAQVYLNGPPGFRTYLLIPFFLDAFHVLISFTITITGTNMNLGDLGEGADVESNSGYYDPYAHGHRGFYGQGYWGRR